MIISAKRISQLYCDGIKEGRATLNLLTEIGATVDAAHMAEIAETLRTKIASGAYGEGNHDFLRGERDFWLNQAKKTGGVS